jgi:hypothetical protein
MAEAVHTRFLKHLYYRRLSSIRTLGTGGFLFSLNGFEKMTFSGLVLKTRIKFLQHFKTSAFLLYFNLKFRICEWQIDFY